MNGSQALNFQLLQGRKFYGVACTGFDILTLPAAARREALRSRIIGRRQPRALHGAGGGQEADPGAAGATPAPRRAKRLSNTGLTGAALAKCGTGMVSAK